MTSKMIFLCFTFALLCCSFHCRQIPRANRVWRDDSRVHAPSLSGAERVAVSAFGVKEDNVGRDDEGLLRSDVDEETMRKAEKTADEDLLSGLSTILKNNETLEDVFKAENVFEFPA